MAKDLELALRIRADMQAAEEKLRHFRDELKRLLGAGDEAGAGADTASKGLDDVSASANTAAAAVTRANVALAASGEAGGMGAALASANELVAATAERATTSITRMGDALGRSHVRVVATIKDFDILDRIQRGTATSAADIAEQEAALDRMMAGGLISRGEQARALEKLTELEVAQTAALEANTGATVANRSAHGGHNRMYMSEHGPRIGIFSMLMRAGAWLITPVGLAVTTLAVALGSFAAAAVVGEEEQKRLNKTLALTGGILGITRGQFEQMATEMATGSTTITRAQKALMAVARTGHFAGREMETVARGVAALSALTGQSVKAAAAEFAKIAEGPAKEAAALNQQYHYLTASVYNQIAALQKEGEAQKAAGLSATTFANAMQRRNERVIQQEHGIVALLHDEYVGWGILWGAMKKAVIPDTLPQKMEAINKQVNATAKALRGLKVGETISPDGFTYFRVTKAYIADIRKQLHGWGVEQAALANKIVAGQRKARGVADLQSEQQGYIAAAADVHALNTQLDSEAAIKAQLVKLARDRAAAETLGANTHAKPADRAAARALIPQIDKDAAALRARHTSAAQKLIAALKTEAANYGLTREQVQLLTLAKGHASAVDLKEARALFHTIAAKKAAAQASKAQAQMLQQERTRVRRIAQSLTGAADATAKFREEQMQLDIALDAGAISTKRYLALTLQLQKLSGAARAQATLKAEQQQVQRLMADEARAEQNIQAEQSAGLLTEYTARARILSLHKQTADQIQKMLPELERLTRLYGSPQQVETLKNIEAQFARMHLQVNQLTQALEQGFTSGLEQAFQGLITGTMTLGQAWRELLNSVLSSIAQIAAKALAAQAIGGIMSLLHLAPTNVGEGAGKLAGASVSLMLGSEMLGINAGQLQAAADALMVANAMSIGGSSGYAAGGHVAGLGRGDTVPALLTPGEFVVRAPIVQQIGLGFLNALNGGTLPQTGHFSSGGAVGLVRSGAMQIENVTRPSGGLNISVPVTVNDSGGGAESIDPQKGKQLGRALKAAVQAVILHEQRPGGLLYQPR